MTFTNQSIQFGSLFLDASSGSAALTSNADYGWDLWTDSGSGATFLSPTGRTDVALDWEQLALTETWLSTSSSQNTWYVAATLVNGVTVIPQMFLTGYGQNGGVAMLQPNGSGGVEMGPCLSTFSLVTPVPVPPSSSSYAPSGWVKVWEDTFTGTSLDTTKWWTRYAGDNGLQQNISSNGELELFSESNNHVMTGNSVKLTAYPPAAGSSNSLSGMLRCKETFNFAGATGIYIEIVAKFPNAQGSWPALWLSAEPKSGTTPAPWPPEADFAEIMNNSANGDNSTQIGVNVQLNQNPPNVWNSNNWSYGSNVPTGWQWEATGRTKWQTTTDLSAGFNTFGFQFVPGVGTVNSITGKASPMLYYFFNGYNTFNAQYDFQVGADGTFPWNGSLLIDLAVGGTGGGTPDYTKFPCDLEIQRVSIYLSQQDSTALVPSVIGQDLMPPTGG